MNRIKKGLLVFFLGAGVLAAAVASGLSRSADHVQFASRVATTDVAGRTLTCTSVNYVVTAAADCELVSVQKGLKTTILFSDIQVGDSAKVCGFLQADNEVIASKIQVFTCK